jgi:hypothetical protein
MSKLCIRKLPRFSTRVGFTLLCKLTATAATPPIACCGDYIAYYMRRMWCARVKFFVCSMYVVLPDSLAVYLVVVQVQVEVVVYFSNQGPVHNVWQLALLLLLLQTSVE